MQASRFVDGGEAPMLLMYGLADSIVGPANLPARLAPAASSLYARNLFNFLGLMIDEDSKSLAIDEEDDLIKGTLLTKDGQVVHPNLVDSKAA